MFNWSLFTACRTTRLDFSLKLSHICAIIVPEGQHCGASLAEKNTAAAWWPGGGYRADYIQGKPPSVATYFSLLIESEG